jgi:hypothetical protein
MRRLMKYLATFIACFGVAPSIADAQFLDLDAMELAHKAHTFWLSELSINDKAKFGYLNFCVDRDSIFVIDQLIPIDNQYGQIEVTMHPGKSLEIHVPKDVREKYFVVAMSVANSCAAFDGIRVFNRRYLRVASVNGKLKLSEFLDSKSD